MENVIMSAFNQKKNNFVKIYVVFLVKQQCYVQLEHILVRFGRLPFFYMSKIGKFSMYTFSYIDCCLSSKNLCFWKLDKFVEKSGTLLFCQNIPISLESFVHIA